MALNFGATLFPPRGELLANFDWTDIANGTGYETYFGAKGDDGEYIATPTTIYSEEIGTHILDQSVATTITKYFDLDFDVVFNTPRIVKGKIFANIPIGIAATTASTKGFEFFAVVKAVHYDGSTETILATGTSKTITGLTNTTTTSFISIAALCIMNVTTQKLFKIGETLRFIVEGWFKTTEGGATNQHIIIAHDPRNRSMGIGNEPLSIVSGEIRLANEPSGGGTITDQTTQMSFQVPFKIES